MPAMTFGSLFAGIGGFDLGFERAGMTCKWQVEIDPFCRKVLAKHWPNVGRYEDVRTVGKHNLGCVDVLCGGFPCQDISNAGKRAGIDGEESRLWAEYHRIIGELLPDIAVMENVTALLVRGMGRVLGDLAEIGYDSEWACIPASLFGSIQPRDRIWIIAYPVRERRSGLFSGGHIGGLGQGRASRQANMQDICISPLQPGDCYPQPLIRGVDGRIPHRMDRVGACGNAVVPQIAEWIGRRIIESSEWGRRQGR